MVDCKKIMTPAMMLGFAGDALTFLGGLILTFDALGPGARISQAE